MKIKSNKNFEKNISGSEYNFNLNDMGKATSGHKRSSRRDQESGRSALERILLPMLVTSAVFLCVLLGIATYEYGTETNAVPISIGNWATVLAASILVMLGLLAVVSDSSTS
ncbi:hypothetical protein [Tropicimonas marinistellae]|uniref:hypothetical protein n=1 Tax=Tropicimonas marinistellae TaxID=1739787 RepID=UPI0008343B43|nr:hypothetical protein [Tropicimonas marinistellae]